MDDSDKIKQMEAGKAEASDVMGLLTSKVNLKQILTNYISQIDTDIAATDAAVADVVTARAAVDADGTVNQNIKAELRALEGALVLFKAETRRYRTAFVWLRDNF